MATEPDPPAAMSRPGAATARPALSAVALTAAFVVLVAFGSFVWYLVTQRNTGEVSWTRLEWLFSSVEAVAFGAAGALFGSGIQRQRAENAEADARANADAAAKGRVLAAVIQADDRTDVGELERLGPAERTQTARHAAIARALFGDVLG